MDLMRASLVPALGPKPRGPEDEPVGEDEEPPRPTPGEDSWPKEQPVEEETGREHKASESRVLREED